MNQENVTPTDLNPPKKESIGQGLLRVAQTITFTLALFMCLIPFLDLHKLGTPGAPLELFAACAAAAILLAFCHFPTFFFRLPRLAQIFAYVGLFGFYPALTNNYVDEMRVAYERTPDGQIEARLRLADEEKSAKLNQATARLQAEKAENDRKLAEMWKTQHELEEYAKKVEGCFTTFGHRLPALEEQVKNRLNNPDSFQHVETISIVPDADRNNISMIFRAENPYGAIMTATVHAQLIADDCEIQSVSNPL